MRPGVLSLAALVLAGLTGCSGAPAAEPGAVHGAATLGPTQPVCREGESCSEPYSGPLSLVRPDGKAARTFTAHNGAFEVQAAPGAYAIRYTASNGWPTCRSPDFEVQSGRTTETAVDCDTGIR